MLLCSPQLRIQSSKLNEMVAQRVSETIAQKLQPHIRDVFTLNEEKRLLHEELAKLKKQGKPSPETDSTMKASKALIETSVGEEGRTGTKSKIEESEEEQQPPENSKLSVNNSLQADEERKNDLGASQTTRASIELAEDKTMHGIDEAKANVELSSKQAETVKEAAVKVAEDDQKFEKDHAALKVSLVPNLLSQQRPPLSRLSSALPVWQAVRKELSSARAVLQAKQKVKPSPKGAPQRATIHV